MNRLFRVFHVSGALLVVTVLVTGCVFGSSLEVFVADLGQGELSLIISTTATTTFCDTEGDGFYSCTFFATGFDEGRISTFTLTDIELALFLNVLDPLVIQLPDAAREFEGSYAHTGSGANGSLEITAGLDSLKIDANRTLTAEPGTQLVILELPDGAPTSGEFAFNFHFDVPDTMTAVDMKPLFSGRVDVATDTFFVPLLPCETNMATVPAVTVPLPAGGLVSLPVHAAQGCTNAVYALAPSSPMTSLYLPVLRN